MTGSYPTPTWGHIDRFCEADGWTCVGTTDHVHWEKVLPSGEVLKTHRSLAANKTISPDLFRLILREQLKVNRDEFWETINSGKPVDRPVPVEEAAPEYPAWVVLGLLKYGLREEDVRAMTPEEAESLLHEKWASPPD